jgi:hypothetical protein
MKNKIKNVLFVLFIYLDAHENPISRSCKIYWEPYDIREEKKGLS